jgi:hypothetical protein
MIDFQSSAIAEYLNYLTTIPPLPAGEGRGSSEHSERLTGCCSGVGELCSRGRQSALIKVGRAYSRAVPFGHSIILSKTLCLCALVPSLEEFVSISLPADSSAIARRATAEALAKVYHVPRGGQPPPPTSLHLCAFALFITPNQPLNVKIPALPAPYRLIPAKKYHANLFYP